MGMVDEAEATVQTLLSELDALNTEITNPAPAKSSKSGKGEAAPARGRWR